MNASASDLRALLRQFGHEDFRPGQERAIRSLLDGRDVLAVQPTGSGKSLIYQIASQLLPGPTVIVSPLIALMKDQEESVEQHDIEVAVVNSTLSKGSIEEELESVERGESKLLYLAPERLSNTDFVERLSAMNVSLLVVDEAHGISEWGHDFRPAYLRLGAVAEALGRPTLLALTATATPWVRNEITEWFGMREPVVIVHGTDRPNLFFEVLRVEDESEDQSMLRRLFEQQSENDQDELTDRLHSLMSGSGIIYCRTTKAVQETSEWLGEWGIAADYYHGQMKKKDRERVQDAFMSGRTRVVCATNAFGLGIDKPDVRFVIHRDIPASVESYYQEAGRAGRDGELARCTLIYRPADLSRAAFMASSGGVTVEDLEKAREALRGSEKMAIEDLQEVSGLGERNLLIVIGALSRAGVLDGNNGSVRMLASDFDPQQISLESEERREAYERSRIEMMRGYAELDECRRRYILNYFGEETEQDQCGLCDNDVRPAEDDWVEAVEEEEVPLPFELGDRVVHDEWGEGAVNRVEADNITILFDEAGYKTVSSQLIKERDLLRRAND